MIDSLLIDLDGVFYEGDKPVPGAAETAAWIRDRGIPHLFVTNTTSRPRRAIVDKLAAMQVTAPEDTILTPPVAASRWLRATSAGPVALFVAPDTVEDFAGLDVAAPGRPAVAAVVVGDYGERWNYAELNRAFRLLMQTPAPTLIALGMTRYWLADDGLRLDTAPFVTALSHASGVEPVVLGKPARPFFDAALATLDTTAERTLMIGDDIRGDVGAAQAAGIAGALVRTGKFRAEDLEGEIRPDWILESIADLPWHWSSIHTRRGRADS